MRKLIIISLLFISISSCSLFRTKIVPYPTGLIFPLDVDTTISYQGEIIDVVQEEGSNLYLSTKDDFVYCLNVQQKKLVWSFQVEGELVSPVYLGRDYIYVYDKDTTLYCLKKDGNLNWKKEIKENITSGVRENEGIIYLGTEKGTLFALNDSQGKKLWAFRAGSSIYSTPIVSAGMIIFGSDDHYLYFLDEQGKLKDKFQAGDKIRVPALVDGNRLYFGSYDHYFYCLNLDKIKKRWRIKTGSRIGTPPIVYKKRIFFLCWNSVLYCLNKNNGSILWWQTLPSRSYYQLTLVDGKIVVTSLSSLLVCFEAKTGKRIGNYKAKQTIKSNPIWFDPFLMVNLYDYRTHQGSLVLLKKKVKVSLKPSKKSPQSIGEEIAFRASTVGFFQPQFEFFLKEKGGEEKTVQEKSETSYWVWYPEKEGTYIIRVKATDEKEEDEAKVTYIIEKKMDQDTLNFIINLIDLLIKIIGL